MKWMSEPVNMLNDLINPNTYNGNEPVVGFYVFVNEKKSIYTLDKLPYTDIKNWKRNKSTGIDCGGR